jgi:hypothetical protein
MTRARQARYGLIVGAATTGALSLGGALVLSAWALLLLPFAIIVGACAWNGLTLAQTWRAMGEAFGDDAGQGPAGMSF